MSTTRDYREPDRSGPSGPVYDDGSIPSDEELVQMDEDVKFWDRPDVQNLLELREREAKAAFEAEQQRQQESAESESEASE